MPKNNTDGFLGLTVADDQLEFDSSFESTRGTIADSGRMIVGIAVLDFGQGESSENAAAF
jgi:hypothetical protein